MTDIVGDDLFKVESRHQDGEQSGADSLADAIPWVLVEVVHARRNRGNGGLGLGRGFGFVDQENRNAFPNGVAEATFGSGTNEPVFLLDQGGFTFWASQNGQQLIGYRGVHNILNFARKGQSTFNSQHVILKNSMLAG